jgi:hypothetical protein
LARLYKAPGATRAGRRCAGVDYLIKMKLASGRPQDLEDVAALTSVGERESTGRRDAD